MATAEHAPDCREKRSAGADFPRQTVRVCRSQSPAHDPHSVSRWQFCPGVCPGCITDEDRARWRQLADEVDAYLVAVGDEDAPPPQATSEDVPLFEEVR